jgi:hypothetical protein
MELVSHPETSTTTVSCSVPVRTARILLFTNGFPNYGNGTCVDNTTAKTHQTHQTPIQTTKLQWIVYNTVDTARMAWATEYFELIAKTASECGIGIDVFCISANELGLPAYQALAEQCLGYVLSHDSFLSHYLQHNLQFVLQHTFMSLTHYTNTTTQQSEKESKQQQPQQRSAADGGGLQQQYQTNISNVVSALQLQQQQ